MQQLESRSVPCPPPARAHRILLAIFFVSGACALVYQVLWVRLLVLVFGATSFAVALVLATFMAGLGLGSLLAARLADRLRSPIRAYALLEAAIAGFALLVPPGIRAIDALQARLLSTEASVLEVLAVQGPLCFVLLLVPTTCMGATLPILSRWISRDEERRGRDLGLLYSINTLGAFVGTLLAGFLCIEHLGIPLTNGLAAASNLGVGAVALLLAGKTASAAPSTSPSTPSPGVLGLLLLASASGFLGLAHEVVWTRVVGMVLVTTTYAYTTLLAIVIGGIGIGSLLGARAADRAPDPVRWFGRLQLGIGIGALGIFPLLLLALQRAPWVLAIDSLPFARSQLAAIGVCVAVTAVPALAMGATFPALARAVTQGSEAVGRQVGRLYVWNTLGGVAGSLVAGFLLLPTLGSFASVQTLAAMNIALGAWVGRPWPLGTHRERVAWAGLVAAALILAGGMSWRVDLDDLYSARLPAGSTILHLEEGVTSTVMVADHSDPPVRRIWIQSVWVAGTGGSHRMLGHLSMLHATDRRRAVGIAFGTGQSFASARLHGLERLDCVDLNEEMVSAGAHWFSEVNHGLLEQEGVHVTIQDGRSFLARSDSSYDALLMEPLQPWSAGAVNLYTREFYELAASRLTEGGVIAQWLPIDDIPPELSRSVVATLAEVFPQTWVYLDNFDLWIVGRRSGPPVEIASWREQIAAGPVRRDLQEIKYGDSESILATLVLGPSDIPGYVGDAPLLTDARPFLEFVAPRTMHHPWFDANVEALLAACRQPLESFVDDPGQPLPPGLSSCQLATSLAEVNRSQEEGRHDEAVEHAAAAFAMAPRAQRVVGFYRDATQYRAEALRAAGRREEAISAYRSHLERDPDFLGIWLNLGLLLVEEGRPEEALRTLESVEDREGPWADRIDQALAILRTQLPPEPQSDDETPSP